MLIAHQMIAVFLSRRHHIFGNPWDYLLDRLLVLSALWALSADHRGKTSMEGFLILLGIFVFFGVVILLIVGLLAGLL